MKKIILSIEGMTCSACSNGLEKYLNKQKGIKQASVNLVLANASIEYDEKILTVDQLNEFVKKAGFKSLGEFKEIKFDKQTKKEKVKFIIFTILAILLMYISMGHMINLPTIPFLDPHTNPTNYMIALLLLTICFVVYGFDILKNGYKNLIHKTPNMDTLVGIGVIASLLYSFYNMYMVFMGHHELVMNLYFESAAIVIYFIKLGRYIDGISKDKTKEAIQKLVKITPNTATLKVDGKEKIVTLDEIHKGDIVISKAGEKVAVDGEIIFGKAHLDESFITGESKPVAKEIGNKVIAGSMNYDGYIEYKAEKIGKESTVSEIVRLVVEASNTKAPIAKIADKVASYFVPIVIIIAIITFVAYLVIGQSFESAISTFVTILVVACPCSLGLATPLAIVVSEGLCASNGILVKKSEILENASKVNTVIFDKTGTLTYGKLKIAKVINYSSLEEKKLLQLVGSIESRSTHPIGKAFTDYLEENKIGVLDVHDFENVAGLGVSGKIDNEEILLGNSKMLDKYDIPNTISNVLAMESMLNQRNQMFRKIFGSSMADHNGDNQVDADDLEAIKQELLEEFGEAVSEPADMAAAQEKLGELAENVMKTMINSDHVTSLDVREMKMLSAQLSVNSILAKEEQYAVPVMVNDELMNVSVKIVRGVDKKGIVDIMMESELRGKIAATFQAKEDGIHGLVTTDSEETAELFKEQVQNLMDSLGGENDDGYAAVLPE